MKVSVIICTYNREKFLPDCLESLVQQNSNPNLYEVIIINNNSSDSTDAICQKFIADHAGHHLVYHVETQQGLSYARNAGIKLSNGEILCYIDDDAIAQSNFIEEIIQAFDKNPQMDGMGGKILAKFESQIPAWHNKFTSPPLFSTHDLGEKEKYYLKSQYPIGCNMAVKRSVIDDIGKFNVKLGRTGKKLLGGEEKDFFQRMKSKNYKIKYIPSVVVQHQIDSYRTDKEFVEKLSKRMGESKKIFARMNSSVLKESLIELYKFMGTLILALFFLFRNPSASKHLIQFRWKLMTSFFLH